MTLKFFLFVLVSALPHYITSIDPGTSVDAFGTQITTLGLITQIEQILYANSTTNSTATSGNLIQFKQCISPVNRQCLTASQDWIVKPNGYGFSLADCNNSSALQQWRLIGDQFLVGSIGTLPDINQNRQACLDCWNAAGDCLMHIFACYNNNRHQQLMVRVHARQINLVESQIYFSIHLKAIPSKCITLFYDSDAKKQGFKMAECEGSDRQSFRIEGDFSKEIKLIRHFVEKQLKFESISYDTNVIPL